MGLHFSDYKTERFSKSHQKNWFFLYFLGLKLQSPIWSLPCQRRLEYANGFLCQANKAKKKKQYPGYDTKLQLIEKI